MIQVSANKYRITPSVSLGEKGVPFEFAAPCTDGFSLVGRFPYGGVCVGVRGVFVCHFVCSFSSH